MDIIPISEERLAKSLAIKDLSDPAGGVHAINLALERIRGCLF